MLETPLEGVSAYYDVGEVPIGEAVEVAVVEFEALGKRRGGPERVGFPWEVRSGQDVERGGAGDGLGLWERVVETDFAPDGEDDRAGVAEDRSVWGVAQGLGVLGEQEPLEVGRSGVAGEDGGVGAGEFGEEGPAGGVCEAAGQGGFPGGLDACERDLA